MYNNYNGPPGQYNQPPGYGGGYSSQQNAPPGMGARPPMNSSMAPGTAGAPGMSPNQSQQQGGFPSNMQMPSNMPSNLNFNAPVIRLGMSGPPTAGSGKPDTPTGGAGGRTDGGGPRRTAGLGYDNTQGEDRRGQRQGVQAIAPPSREEIARTILVANITEGVTEEGVQSILACAGGLRRWTRCMDAENKPCSFGFAEFEDADSLGIACEIFQDVEIPKTKPTAKPSQKQNGDAMNGVLKEGEEESENKEENDEGPEKAKLHVIIDDESRQYVKEWEGRGAVANEDDRQFRLDSARDDLANLLAGLFRPKEPEVANGNAEAIAQQASTEQKMDAVTGQIVEIPITIEDELADIPAEMRETVAKEIAAFRDRSNKRDMERLKKEEEMEQAEKSRSRGSALPASTPTGPSGSTNGIPVGPRDRSGQNPPTGPRGQGSQMPDDFRKGVNFVNGSAGYPFTQEEEDSDASDDEIERRHQAKKNGEAHKRYVEQLRRWENREKNRNMSIQRQQEQDGKEDEDRKRLKESMARKMRAFNDDDEASRRSEEYHRDRQAWSRNRASFRKGEYAQDERDRKAEDAEKARAEEQRAKEMGMADKFLAEQAKEMSRAEPQRFKLSLGEAAQRVQQASSKRTMDQIEFLLEDEEDTATVGQKRQLVPIKFDAIAASMSEEERQQAARQLASEIPSDKEGLWAWDVQWDYLDENVIAQQLRPFVEKKIVEYLGVQEQMLVDLVEESVRKRASPTELIGELEGPLEDEAEVLVKKLWRMLIFFTESEKKGLSA